MRISNSDTINNTKIKKWFNRRNVVIKNEYLDFLIS
jgi:hypothetical protein